MGSKVKTFEEKLAELDRERAAILGKDNMRYYILSAEYFGIDSESPIEYQQGMHDAALDPDTANDIRKEIDERLYGKIPTSDKKKSEKSPIIRERNYENYGIKEKVLNKLPYSTIREIYFGMQNFDCPELYISMNPTEILGLWAGIGRKDKRFQSSIKKTSTGTISLTDTISELVQTGYKQSADTTKRDKEVMLAYIAHHVNKDVDKYDATVNSMKERLDIIDENTADEAIRQLTLPKRYTDRERETHYMEPGFDSRNLIYDPAQKSVNDRSSVSIADMKKIHISMIMNHLHNSYNNHIQKYNRG